MSPSPTYLPSAAPGSGLHEALAWLESGPKRMLIGGEWVDSLSGKTFETSDPSTEQVLAHVFEAESADIDAAVKAARRAFKSSTKANKETEIWKR